MASRVPKLIFPVILGGVIDVFDSPVLRVQQPRKVLPTKAQYNIFNAESVLVAVATETDARTRRKALQAARPGSPLLGARALLLTTADGVPLLTIDKQTGQRVTAVRGPDGGPIGAIRAERTTRHYALLDAEDHPIGQITGDLSLRRFTVADGEGKRVARVSKKWAGLATEVLTTADRYNVEISGPVSEPLRTLVVVSAIVLDLTLHEFKDLV
ncbi:MAG: Scramblase family protein [Actinomycetia bacterium]|nr:Scramblase family protein [Actinomycetes bacterium]